MLHFSNCKINVGLDIVEKRSDGFHNIESVFIPISLSDIIEIIENKQPTKQNVIFENTGITLDCKPSDNLILKAYQLLTIDFHLPPVQIYLHKIIPLGAGLGGGSSNAAFTLKTLNNLFSLGLTDDNLENYARKIGSDCAFFIKNKTSFCYEKGDLFRSVSANFTDYFIVLINPGIHINTSVAYTNCSPQKPVNSIETLINNPIEKWKDTIKNDFEKNVFIKFPEILEIKNKLYELGACYASMSGSGSSVYGIFKREIGLYNYFSNYFVWQGKSIMNDKLRITDYEKF